MKYVDNAKMNEFHTFLIQDLLLFCTFGNS